MEEKKYISLARLKKFLDLLKENFAALGHKHNVSDIADYANADWNQNDPNAVGYIENRTHYVEPEFVVEIPSTSISNSGWFLRDTINYGEDEILWTNTLMSRNDWIVSINGTKYHLSTWDWSDDWNNTTCLGDSRLMDAPARDENGDIKYDDDGEIIWTPCTIHPMDGVPFAIECYREDDGSGWTWFEHGNIYFAEDFDATNAIIEIGYAGENETIHQLDEKFIPDTIARVSDIPEGAIVDSELSTSSVNPVQNKVITNTLNTLVGDKPVAEQINEALEAIPQSDWNQSDESAADYIKNRTHWVDANIDETILSQRTLALEDVISANGVSSKGAAWTDAEGFAGLEAGINYIVKFNGISYACTATQGISGGLLGNPALNLYGVYADPSEYPPTDHPFLVEFGMEEALWEVTTDLSLETVDIEIFKGTEEVHQLDDKFISDTIARVDELPQSDWNQNNAGAVDYVKNRTHWVEEATEVVVEETTEWDNIKTLDGELFSSTSYVVTVDGVKYTCQLYHNDLDELCLGDSRLQDNDMSNPIDVPFLAISGWAPIENDYGVLEEVAIVFVYYPDHNAHTIKIEKLTGDTTYHTLDERFIPETIARKSDINTLELITVEDIDAICGGAIQYAEDVMF